MAPTGTPFRAVESLQKNTCPHFQAFVLLVIAEKLRSNFPHPPTVLTLLHPFPVGPSTAYPMGAFIIYMPLILHYIISAHLIHMGANIE